MGVVLGVAGAMGIGRAAESLLFGIDAHDPLVFGAAVALLTTVTFTAGYLPAWRASRVGPMEALRAQ